MKDTINIVWHWMDVQKERPDLNATQCRTVLAALKDNHDACIGINWEVIRAMADDLYLEVKR